MGGYDRVRAAVITQIGDKLGIVLDSEIVENENLKVGDVIAFEKRSAEPSVISPEEADEASKQWIELNDELFRSLS